MLSRQKVESSWLSFVAGALSATLFWSLGWAARSILFPQDYRPKLDQGGDDDDDSDNESSTSIGDDASGSNTPHRKRLVRWPWDKLRKSVLLNLDLEVGDESDASVANKTGPCIGEIFGLDVGGTLTKLVYFEQQIVELKRQGSHDGLHRREHYNAAASALEVLQARRSESMRVMPHNTDSDADLQGLWGMRQESVPDRLDEFASSCNIGESLSPKEAGSEGINGHDQSEQPEESPGMGMKRSKSMINISKSTEHAEALDNFYSFARRLDNYDTGVKDKHLSYYSRYLNGTFHFIRFETRRMSHAMNLMKINNLHRHIKEMGATGELHVIILLPIGVGCFHLD